MDSQPEAMARPASALALAETLSRLAVANPDAAGWRRDPDRGNFEYRDLGVAAATGGRVGAKHVRMVAPFSAPTGWHWHDQSFHLVYVLKGWIEFEIRGHAGRVRIVAGGAINQPVGVPHNVVGYAPDLETIEVYMPAEYGTFELT